MGYMFRCNPAVQFCLQAVRDGLLGTIVHAEADMNFSASDPAYADYVSSFKAGVFYNLACHEIDLFAAMMKGDLVRATISVGDAPGDPPGSRTRCAAMLEWPESTAFLRACSHVPQGIRRRLRVEGSNGTLELQPIECFSGKPLKVVLHIAKAAGPYVAGLHEFEFGPQTDRYAGLFLELAAIVRGKKPNPVELYDHDLKVHDTCLRACGLC
jgi:predicted dehydrogenase